MCTPTARSASRPSTIAILHTSRQFTSLVSKSASQLSSSTIVQSAPSVFSSLSSLPANQVHPNQLRHYSLDRPSSPFSIFSSSTHDSSPYGQNLEMSQWPIRKTNTILNIVPQGKRMVVERFGKLHAIHESGYFFAVPSLDSIAYVIDIRERALDIVPQSAITRDNVSVEVSGNLFVSVVDPEKAAYGARNPLYSVMMVSLLIGCFESTKR
jgi:hypothetical protein